MDTYPENPQCPTIESYEALARAVMENRMAPIMQLRLVSERVNALLAIAEEKGLVIYGRSLTLETCNKIYRRILRNTKAEAREQWSRDCSAGKFLPITKPCTEPDKAV